MGRWHTFLRLGWADRFHFAVALALLAGAALAIPLVPLRRMAPWLGEAIGPVGLVPLASASEQRRARALRHALGRAASIMPLRADCYPQALAGVLLCRLYRVPVAMHLGVRLGDGGAIDAHAWLCSGRIAISGGAGFARYTPVACFLAA